MPPKFICTGCGLEREINPHLKGTQKYCRDPKCQRDRKRAWQKHKMSTDARYRKKHDAAQKRWCQEYPLDRYQAQYRQTHPKYVEKNREQQRARNAKRRPKAASAGVETIVKMDASPEIKSGTYLLSPYVMDASPRSEE